MYVVFVQIHSLFKRNESGRRGSTLSRSLVGNRSVSNRELTKVVTNHLRLDLNLVENLSVVNTNNRSNHLGKNDHVSEVGLDDSRLLVRASSKLGSSELLHESVRLDLKTVLQSSSNTGVGDVAEVLKGELEEILEVHTSVGELLE